MFEEIVELKLEGFLEADDVGVCVADDLRGEVAPVRPSVFAVRSESVSMLKVRMVISGVI